jgi:amino acid transporter
MATAPQEETRTAHFRLWDAVAIIVGIIIGAGIFKTPGSVFALCDGPGEAILFWIIAGVLCLIGALCFAELAACYPHSGGEYVYLTRAFGPLTGFLYAWGQLLFIRTGASIVSIAYVFADYTLELGGADKDAPELAAVYITLTVIPILVLTGISVVGVHFGKWTQNTLTVVKVLGLGAVLVAGFLWARSYAPGQEYHVYQGTITQVVDNGLVLRRYGGFLPKDQGITLTPKTKLTKNGEEKDSSGQPFVAGDLKGLKARVLVRAEDPNRAVRVKATDRSVFTTLSLVFVLVMFSYAGWNEAAYIAAEIHDQRRNVPRALILGTGAVMVIYVAVNLAYIIGLGFEDASDSGVVAKDVLALVPWDVAQPAICLLVIISVLGSMNGTIVTSSRIFAAFGKDHRFFAPLGHWDPRLGTPVISLLVQLLVCLLTVAAVAAFFPTRSSFESLVEGTAAVFWLYYLATGIALFVLRRRDADAPRPFLVPLYPVTPVIYCVFCAWLVGGSLFAMPRETLFCFILLALGVPLFWLTRHRPNLESPAPTQSVSEG